MIKKILLNTVAAIAIFSACNVPAAFSMDEQAGGGVVRLSFGGVMMTANAHRAVKLLTKQELDQQGLRRQSRHASHYPLFDTDRDSWRNYRTEDFQRILDGRSSGTARLRAFNRLSYCVGNELDFTRHPELSSLEYNEKHVATVRWLAKAVLWNDSTMDTSERTSFNHILLKILTHNEDGQRIYHGYLDTIYCHLRHAVKIQEYLIQISSSEERFLAAVPTVSNARRILGILKADQARVYELKLLKRKMDDGLDLSDPRSNSLADRLQILRQYAYDFYGEASDNGGSKLCILQRMKLIDEQGYSPTGDRERDKTILLELGEIYINEKDDAVETVAVRTRARARIGGASRERILGAVPKPREAKKYIADVFGKYLIGDFDDAGRAVLGRSTDVDSGGEDESVDSVTVSVISASASVLSTSTAANDDLVESSSDGINGGFMQALVIDTSVSAPSPGMLSGRSSARSNPFTPAQRDSMKIMFGEGKKNAQIAKDLGLKPHVVNDFKRRHLDLLEYNPDYDGSYNLTETEKERIKSLYQKDGDRTTRAEIAARYNCPFSQVDRALQKRDAKSRDESDNEGGERDDERSSDEGASARPLKRARK